MPYKSEAQRKYFNANRDKLEAEGVDVDEWNESSKGKKLPEKKSAAAMLGKAAADNGRPPEYREPYPNFYRFFDDFQNLNNRYSVLAESDKSNPSDNDWLKRFIDSRTVFYGNHSGLIDSIYDRRTIPTSASYSDTAGGVGRREFLPDEVDKIRQFVRSAREDATKEHEGRLSAYNDANNQAADDRIRANALSRRQSRNTLLSTGGGAVAGGALANYLHRKYREDEGDEGSGLERNLITAAGGLGGGALGYGISRLMQAKKASHQEWNEMSKGKKLPEKAEKKAMSDLNKRMLIGGGIGGVLGAGADWLDDDEDKEPDSLLDGILGGAGLGAAAGGLYHTLQPRKAYGGPPMGGPPMGGITPPSPGTPTPMMEPDLLSPSDQARLKAEGFSDRPSPVDLPSSSTPGSKSLGEVLPEGYREDAQRHAQNYRDSGKAVIDSANSDKPFYQDISDKAIDRKVEIQRPTQAEFEAQLAEGDAAEIGAAAASHGTIQEQPQVSLPGGQDIPINAARMAKDQIMLPPGADAAELSHELTHGTQARPVIGSRESIYRPYYEDSVAEVSKASGRNPEELARYLTNPLEEEAYLANIKRKYFEATGKHVRNQDDAKDAIRWLRSQPKPRSEAMLESLLREDGPHRERWENALIERMPGLVDNRNYSSQNKHAGASKMENITEKEAKAVARNVRERLARQIAKEKVGMDKEAIGGLVGGSLGALIGAGNSRKRGESPRYGAEDGFVRGGFTGAGAGLGGVLGAMGSMSLMDGKPSTVKGIIAGLLPLLGAGVGGYTGYRGSEGIVDGMRKSRIPAESSEDESFEETDSDVDQEKAAGLLTGAMGLLKKAPGFLKNRASQAWMPKALGSGPVKPWLRNANKLEGAAHQLGQPALGGVGGYVGTGVADPNATFEQKMMGAAGGATMTSPLFRKYLMDKGVSKFRNAPLREAAELGLDRPDVMSEAGAKALGLGGGMPTAAVLKGGGIYGLGAIQDAAGAIKSVKDVAGQAAEQPDTYTITDKKGKKHQVSGEVWKQLDRGKGSNSPAAKKKTTGQQVAAAQKLIDAGGTGERDRSGISALNQAGSDIGDMAETLQEGTGTATDNIVDATGSISDAAEGINKATAPLEDASKAVGDLTKSTKPIGELADTANKGLQAAGKGISDFSNWTKDNAGKLGLGALGAAGLYGLYKVMSSKSREKEEEEKARERRQLLLAAPDGYRKAGSAMPATVQQLAVVAARKSQQG
jgi:hypothetical protein